METLASGYGLIEGPVWDPARGLIFSDVHHGGVYCLRTTGEIETVVEHRRGIGAWRCTRTVD
jgi:gluconolactonase